MFVAGVFFTDITIFRFGFPYFGTILRVTPKCIIPQIKSEFFHSWLTRLCCFVLLWASAISLHLWYKVRKGNVRYTEVGQQCGGAIQPNYTLECSFHLSRQSIALECQRAAHRTCSSAWATALNSLKEIGDIFFLFSVPSGLTLSRLGVTHSSPRNKCLLALGIPGRLKFGLPPDLHLFTVNWKAYVHKGYVQWLGVRRHQQL